MKIVVAVKRVAVGLTAVTGQLLTPLAGDLASDSKRGQVVGTVASGLLTGILVSRTASGLLADAFGWRAIYGVAAVADAALAILLARAIPVLPTRPVVKYAALLGSVFAAVRRYRSVQITLVIGALSFAVFTLFWTGLTFLLSSPPFSFSVTKIGLVGLVGLAGAVAAQRAGRLHDRGWSIPATGAGLALALASLVLAAAAGSSIVIVLAAVLLIDIAIQGVNVLNQTRLFSVDRAARSRLNTAFVACNFLGGAVGSLLAGVLWSRFAWFGITFGGAAAIGVALIVWNAQRGRALAFPLRSDRAE